MTLKEELIEYAKSVGIDLVGVTTPEPFDVFLKEFEDRKELYRGRYEYRFDNWRKLATPKAVLPEAKSVVVLGVNYYTPELESIDGDARFGKIVTYGHLGIYRKLKLVCKFMEAKGYKVVPGLHRKQAAQRAGLGALGKNDLVINETYGTWVAYQSFVTDAELEFDAPYEKDICGNCTDCLDACPTKALIGPYKLDPAKCITCLLTSKDIPEEHWDKLSGYIMGCDICQLKCPKNKQVIASEDIISIFPAWAGDSPSLEMMLTISESKFQNKLMAHVMGLFLGNPFIGIITRFSFLKKILKKIVGGGKSETLPETFQMASGKLGAYQRNAILAAGRSGKKEYIQLLTPYLKVPEMKKYAEWSLNLLNK